MGIFGGTVFLLLGLPGGGSGVVVSWGGGFVFLSLARGKPFGGGVLFRNFFSVDGGKASGLFLS